MTKTEYLRELDRYLKKLPRVDYEEAMAYFTEYFDEAGDENAQQVMADLGTPKEAANELIQNLLDDTAPLAKRQRSTKEKILLATLALLSAPVTIPLIISFIAIIFAAIITILALLFTGLVLSGVGLLVGVVLIADSFGFLSYSSAFLMGLGGGLAALGGSIILLVVILALCKIFFQLIKALVKWMLRKVRRHEK